MINRNKNIIAKVTALTDSKTNDSSDSHKLTNKINYLNSRLVDVIYNGFIDTLPPHYFPQNRLL